MGEGKAAGHTRLTDELSTKRGGSAKRKKEAKKEKRVEIWKTEGVSHIPTRQTNNKLFNFIFKKRTCIVFTGLTHKSV
jgi:hypothetical protein